jgi:GT2 family glycosyltransferase
MNKKFLVFIVHYNSFYLLKKIINEINKIDNKNFEVLISDDCSDLSIKKLKKLIESSKKKFFLNRNKYNFGYGKNIKYCLNFALKKKYKYALMLHGDNQYKTKYIKTLFSKIKKYNLDIICGSRMLKKSYAIKGKMPIYKFLGNIILTFFFNKIFKTKITDAHSGLWVYNLDIFKKIKLKNLSNGYLFDHELRIELIKNGFDVNNEISIETKYSSEKSKFHISYSINFVLRMLKFKFLNN